MTQFRVLGLGMWPVNLKLCNSSPSPERNLVAEQGALSPSLLCFNLLFRGEGLFRDDG